MEKDFINIMISADDNYAQHAIVMLTSMFENTDFGANIRVYLVSNGVSEITLKLINETTNKYNAYFQNIVIAKKEVENFHVERDMTSAAYFRLYAADILPQNIDRVIYMDVDLIFQDDIKKLWDISLDGYPIGAVVEQGMMGIKGKMAETNKALKLSENNLYFNSGLLLIDLKQWRENNYSQQLVKLAKENNFTYHDQDALNKFFAGNYKILPARWNAGDFLIAVHIRSLLIKGFRKLYVPLSKIAVFHYCAAHKPWEYDELQGYNDKYYYYLKKSCLGVNTSPRKDIKLMKRFMRRVWLTKVLDKIFGG